jgi:endonuclease YncB( thermonuclease family)
MKTYLMILMFITIFLNGCYVNEAEKGSIADIPYFLLDGNTGDTTKTDKGFTKDQLVEVMDADTFEFEGRTLELYQVKAPELNDKSVAESQASQCAEADLAVITAMAKKSKEYTTNNFIPGKWSDIDLKTNRDRYRKQVGMILKTRGTKGVQTFGLSLVRNGYAVPSNYKNNNRLNDAEYQIALQKYMTDAIDNNRGLWADYPAEMKCLANINSH